MSRPLSIGVAVFLAVAGSAAMALAHAGDFDPSFDGDGRKTIDTVAERATQAGMCPPARSKTKRVP
jgi:hypothetical protein